MGQRGVDTARSESHRKWEPPVVGATGSGESPEVAAAGSGSGQRWGGREREG